MAADISDNAGGTSGSQKIGSITVNLGNRSTSRYYPEQTPASGWNDGDFHGVHAITIASISGKYDSRFDDTGYY
jgi:hypothetical protein